MQAENVGAVVITEKTRPVGIVTDRDLAFAVCTGGCNPRDEVQSVMTCPVETICGDEGVYNATQKMMELAVRRLPVVNYMGLSSVSSASTICCSFSAASSISWRKGFRRRPRRPPLLDESRLSSGF